MEQKIQPKAVHIFLRLSNTGAGICKFEDWDLLLSYAVLLMALCEGWSCFKAFDFKEQCIVKLVF